MEVGLEGRGGERGGREKLLSHRYVLGYSHRAEEGEAPGLS